MIAFPLFRSNWDMLLNSFLIAALNISFQEVPKNQTETLNMDPLQPSSFQGLGRVGQRLVCIDSLRAGNEAALRATLCEQATLLCALRYEMI